MRLSFLMEVSCSCPGALGSPGYYREREVSLHLQDQNGSLRLHQIQAPLLGLPVVAGGREGEGDQKGSGNVGVNEDHGQLVELWYNLLKHRGLLKYEVVVFLVWVFS